jgi:hypothetical protein
MRLTADQRRALRLLAGAPHGVTEAMRLAHGFRREMLARLVLRGLATVTTGTMRAGAATMKVERLSDTGLRTTGGVRSRPKARPGNEITPFLEPSRPAFHPPPADHRPPRRLAGERDCDGCADAEVAAPSDQSAAVFIRAATM